MLTRSRSLVPFWLHRRVVSFSAFPFDSSEPQRGEARDALIAAIIISGPGTEVFRPVLSLYLILYSTTITPPH
ncbi:hypothetical protein BJY01DRAFT_221123 [Aspergillus pseudoustus]|uniref:Uncharacterized protein n=1 Tax=Aspergillus pseudoustus TaxID=1810923 RepID=A0ABR4JC19_9EURO